MLKVHALKQPSVIISGLRSTLCGPTCLRMVLEYYGVKKTEKDLVKLVNYDPNLLDKRGALRLASAAKKLGFRATVKDNCTLKDIRQYVLKQKVPAIVNWFSVNEGHYSVVTHIDHKRVVLADPETAGLRRMPLQEFEAVWFDFSPHDSRAPKALVVRRMIVIEPQDPQMQNPPATTSQMLAGGFCDSQALLLISYVPRRAWSSRT